MDPDECLATIRKLHERDGYEEGCDTLARLILLSEYVRDLDEWLSNGGRLPKDWKHGP